VKKEGISPGAGKRCQQSRKKKGSAQFAARNRSRRRLKRRGLETGEETVVYFEVKKLTDQKIECKKRSLLPG